jgi:hypothetical protein
MSYIDEGPDRCDGCRKVTNTSKLCNSCIDKERYTTCSVCEKEDQCEWTCRHCQENDYEKERLTARVAELEAIIADMQSS